MKILFVVAVFSFVAFANGLFTQCPGTKEVENFEQQFAISGCKKTYCRLRKKTLVDVVIKFTPDKDIKGLTNTVSAQIAGIPFPFIGVDGENACTNVFQADGITAAPCPLKAGTEYVYKTQINVLEIYPRLKVIVHWALTASDGNDITCFEVPARITN